ncbi:hypothetical protein GC174_11845 [bacterium]|nr:hypothetical protein [bacterium]
MTRAALVIIVVLFMAGVVFCWPLKFRKGMPSNNATVSDCRIGRILPKVTVSRNIVKTLRPIKQGEMFDRESVEEVSVSSANEDYLAADYAYASYMVLGRRAARDLPVGTWLAENDCIDTYEDMR